MTTASYARYSSDKQRETSIADQERKADNLIADKLQTAITHRYRDSAESGWDPGREDYQRLTRDAAAGVFNVLALDDLSRLGRDQDERGLAIRRLEFHGVRILTASGYDSQMPLPLRTMMRSASGMVDSMYSIDLAEKTHRGLTGQALKGFNAGGRSYGYRHVPILDETRRDEYGRPVIIAVRRAVDPQQAAVAREIFNLFLAGLSARRIAHELNRQGIPGPRGGPWRLSSIYGDKRSGVGILNNPLYNGDMIWNRSRWLRDPDTGKRRRRERPQAEWIVHHDESLRIVTPRQWAAAQARMARREHRPGRKPRHLLSGILRCGLCGGAYVKVDAYRYGCATHKDAGTCGNGMKVAVKVAERGLLAGVKRDLLNEEALELFRRETAALIKAEKKGDDLPSRRAAVEREIDNLVKAIKAGADIPAVRDALKSAEDQRRTIAAEIKAREKLEDLPDFLPRASDIFRDMIVNLEQTLRAAPDQARELLRQLLGDSIVLTPKPAEKAMDAAVPSQGVIRLAMAMASGSDLDNVVAGAASGHQCTIISIPASGSVNANKA